MIILLEGLNCAVCSKKIQKEINELADVKNAEINLMSKELRVNFENKINKKEFFNKVETIVHYYEPDVLVRLPEEAEEISEENKKNTPDSIIKNNLLEFIGIIIFALAYFIDNMLINYSIVSIILYISAYLLIGGDVLLKSAKNIAKGKVFDENFLMSVATIGAMCLGDFVESVAVMLFYKVGETLSDYAQNKSISSINALLKLKIPYANVISGEGTKKVPSEQVSPGDLLIVKAGEQIPVDGIITVGEAYVDTKSITGEPVEKLVKADNEVFAGYIVSDGPITIKATKSFENSMIAKIIYLTKEASQNKAKAEKFITKFAAYYTPAVVGAAVLIAVIPVIFGMGSFGEWLKRGLIFLVISCPCALVLSVPLGYFAGIGAASKKGILIKGANYMETLSEVKTAVFDKTGTLTKGVFTVKEMVSKDTVSAEELKEFFVASEYYSNHPIAKAIRNHFGITVDEKEIMDYKEIAGKGVTLKYHGNEIKAGTAGFTEISNEERVSKGTAVYLTINGKFAGYCSLADELKKETKKALQDLRSIGITKTVMLTGDNNNTARAIAEEAGIDEVKAGLLPDEKVKAYQQIVSDGKIFYVGDGINDAPVLAMADVGISMGALGSDAAIEAADAVIMTDNLSELVKIIKLSKYTKKIIMQNILFVLSVKVFFLLLGAAGVATMGEAVFADVGTALLATLNAMRILKYKAV